MMQGKSTRRRIMLQKFVYWTGAFDFVVGLATWGGAINAIMQPEPVPGQFTSLITLGTFLMMAAALLMWASADMKNRAPILVWQGFVRLSAVAALLYAGFAQSPWEYLLIPFDGTIGIVYILGAMKVTGCSLPQLIMCKTDPAT
jgi:hypothetical protein